MAARSTAPRAATVRLRTHRGTAAPRLAYSSTAAGDEAAAAPPPRGRTPAAAVAARPTAPPPASPEWTGNRTDAEDEDAVLDDVSPEDDDATAEGPVAPRCRVRISGLQFRTDLNEKVSEHAQLECDRPRECLLPPELSSRTNVNKQLKRDRSSECPLTSRLTSCAPNVPPPRARRRARAGGGRCPGLGFARVRVASQTAFFGVSHRPFVWACRSSSLCQWIPSGLTATAPAPFVPPAIL